MRQWALKKDGEIVPETVRRYAVDSYAALGMDTSDKIIDGWGNGYELVPVEVREIE